MSKYFMDQETITAENNPFFEHPKQTKSLAQRLIDSLQGVVLGIFILIVLYMLVVTPNQIDGDSMLPGLVHGDVVLTNRLAGWFHGTPFGEATGLTYNRGDIVVTTSPNIPGKDFVIKRVIGLGEETVSIKDGYIYINGLRLDETAYLSPSLRTKAGTFLLEGDVLPVPSNSFFLLGDNRPGSLDSRDLKLGFVSKNQIVGKAILRFLPLESFGLISGVDPELTP